MKLNSARHFFIVAWIVLSILSGCKKEVVRPLPVIVTLKITNASANSVVSGGVITSSDSLAVTACGVCWSTSQNPTIANSKTADGSGTGSFTSVISGLTTETTYYVRAYATNSSGTGYGNQITFEINDYLPLIVGAKYKYGYSNSYSYINESSHTTGECT